MISVIVPIYNVEKYIERCISSISNQSYPDWELLLINDGSTDSSYEICEKWSKTDARIKVFSKPNGGVSSARNLGLDHAAGDYIFFVDADDWISPNCFEQMIQKMTPEIDLVIGEHQDATDDDGDAHVEHTTHKNYEGILSHEETISDIYRLEFYTRVIWGKLYRKELWQNLRFNHMIYSEDTYAMFQVLEQVQCAYSIQEPLYFYLLRSSGASRNKRLLEYENFLETLLFMYSKALEKYPFHKEAAARRYNNIAYILLKAYVQSHQKDKSFALIETMKYVYKTSATKHPSFSQRMLVFPKSIVYLLICIKNSRN